MTRTYIVTFTGDWQVTLDLDRYPDASEQDLLEEARELACELFSPLEMDWETADEVVDWETYLERTRTRKEQPDAGNPDAPPPF
jgi:hypothetical protein